MQNKILAIVLRDYFWIKNVELILHWHPVSVISCNIAPSRTQIFY